MTRSGRMQSMVRSPKVAFPRFQGMRWLSLLCMIAGALVCHSTRAWGQAGFEDLLDGRLKPGSQPKAAFTAELTPSTAQPGDVVTLTVTAKLPPKSYIYSTTGDFQLRTKITVTSKIGLEEAEADFHADREPETKLDPVLNQPLSKFHGDVSWTKKFRVEAGADPGKVEIDLELEGQYCSEGLGGTCTLLVPPVKLRASLASAKQDTTRVADAPAPVADAPQNEPVFEFTKRPTRGKTNPAELHFQLAEDKESSGKKVKLAITMKLDPGWHTFSTTFKGEGGSPTEITLDKISGLKPIGKGFAPSREPEIKVEKELELRLEVYHESITWVQEFELLPDTKPNEFGVEGSITYQTCKSSCLPARSEPFVLGVVKADALTATAVAPPPEHAIGPRPQDKGLLVFLLTAMGAGAVALLTPCVFPMIPITVSFFLKQNEAKGGRPIVLALVFSAAIVAAFVVIGVGIAAIFGATKPNELANNWILNLFLSTVFFAFALNMLGMFEIQVPSWLLNLTSSGEQSGGYIGVVFMALTFVLTSFSCTFAFVGSLLAAAAQGDYYWPVLGMAAFGATFATPFFLLALMPGTLKSLPKSGGWLNAVKVVMGFVELGVAVKYISIVDQQWNSVPWLFDFTNVMMLWAVLSACTGLYLLGQFRLSHDSPVQGLSPIRVLLATGFLLLGGLFVVGLAQPQREAWFVDQLVSFAPARLDSTEFELDFDVAVANASQANRPMFVDFTGVFCTNCRLMEKRMAKPINHSRLAKFVQVQLYTDKVPKLTNEADAKRILARNVALQVDWFGDVTLPSYAVVTPDGKTILSSFFGLEQHEGDFAQFLDDGWMKWQSVKGHSPNERAASQPVSPMH